MSALPQKRKAVDARRALPSSQHPFNHLLFGEVLSEGIGRPAPVVSPGWSLPCAYGSALRSRSVASGPDRRYTPAIRLVATCDDGAVAGDPASTFRTAVRTLVAPHGDPNSPRAAVISPTAETGVFVSSNSHGGDQNPGSAHTIGWDEPIGPQAIDRYRPCDIEHSLAQRDERTAAPGAHCASVQGCVLKC